MSVLMQNVQLLIYSVHFIEEKKRYFLSLLLTYTLSAKWDIKYSEPAVTVEMT